METPIDVEEMTGYSHGWQAEDETEFFMEETLPNLIEEEKKEVMEFLLKVFYF